MTISKKLSINTESKLFKYSILIGDDFSRLLEKNFSNTLKRTKIYVIYDEFFDKLKLNENLIQKFKKLSISCRI